MSCCWSFDFGRLVRQSPHTRHPRMDAPHSRKSFTHSDMHAKTMRSASSWSVRAFHRMSSPVIPYYVFGTQQDEALRSVGLFSNVGAKHVMSYHAMSRHVMSCHVMSCHVMSCHVMSCHVMSCHVMSCHVMSCHVMSCHVMSCHVMSCQSHVTSRLVKPDNMASCEIRPLSCSFFYVNLLSHSLPQLVVGSPRR